MINIGQLISGLTHLIGESEFPDAAILAAALGLDISQAAITKTKQGNLGINGARLNGSGVGIACGLVPRREIWILFDNSSTPYRAVRDETFGANQRIEQSKVGTGFGVVFEIGGLVCGYTADSPDADVDAIFCEESTPSSSRKN